MGATVVHPTGLDPTHGIPRGPGLRVPLGGRSMDVTTWSQRSKTRTVARVRVETGSPFSFVARGSGREPKMLSGLQQGAVAFALRGMARSQDDPRRAAAAQAIAYLAEPPMRTGHDELDRIMVLRSNQPDVARALFTSGPLVSMLEALHEKTRFWDWTYYPDSAGFAEMQIEIPGGIDEESVRAIQAVMGQALEHLAGQGAIAA